jgi:hypothetical protein
VDDAAWLDGELQRYGADRSGIIRFDGPLQPEHLPHLDLWPVSGSPPLVDAVVEMQNRPVLYAVRGPRTAEQVRTLAHLLTQRAAADHIAVVEPGCLSVYPVVAQKRVRARHCKASDAQAATQIPRLTLALDGGDARGAAGTLHNELVKRLQESTVRIEATRRVGHDDALSLVGRALFMRFLIDRRVVTPADLPDICPRSGKLALCMETPERAARTFAWLDETFNGNLLKLPHDGQEAFWKALGPAREGVCEELTRILLRADASGQLTFDWAALDFSHIPVGLLSQVYEHYCHTFLPRRATAQSVHYTPRSIAEYMVGEVFARMRESGGVPVQPHRAHVLDPAVGAGVFLVATLRALIEARWRADAQRPGTQTIREILYTQLKGFDVNDAALKLTALSLYLTALELDPAPRPLTALKFEDLRGRVLFDMRSPADREHETEGLPALGSLGPHVPTEHRGKYHVVIGNPPWTAWERPTRGSLSLSRFAALNAAFEEHAKAVVGLVRKISEERLGRPAGRTVDPNVHTKGDLRTIREPSKEEPGPSAEHPFELVDLTPDIPFCWRALDWAVAGGQIALALHARILFKRSEVGARAREMLFRGTRVTGILNGAALRETMVWPKVKAPFCLLFAENAKPNPSDTFTFVSPLYEAGLNRRGHLRIDANAAHEVAWQDVARTPSLLKTLFRGTDLDVAVVTRLRDAGGVPLGKYWKSTLGLAHGQGYRLGGERSHQLPANHLRDLPDLTSAYEGAILISTRTLDAFERATAAFPRDPDIYRRPLVLVKQSPGANRNDGRALLSVHPVAYSESFYGFSCAGHPQPRLLSRYLLLLMNSDLVLYWALMESGKFGVERPVLQKTDLEQFPILPLESLGQKDLDAIERLSELLLVGEERPWSDVDEWIGNLYGLSRWDVATMRDTLSVALPWEGPQDNAQRRPEREEIDRFTRDCESLLSKLAKRAGRQVSVAVVRASEAEPWCFLRAVSWPSGGRAPEVPALLDRELAVFIHEAELQGATQIIHVPGDGGTLTVGILTQYRYWTPSRARLLSLDLVRRHEATLLGGEST